MLFYLGKIQHRNGRRQSKWIHWKIHLRIQMSASGFKLFSRLQWSIMLLLNFSSQKKLLSASIWEVSFTKACYHCSCDTCYTCDLYLWRLLCYPFRGTTDLYGHMSVGQWKSATKLSRQSKGSVQTCAVLSRSLINKKEACKAIKFSLISLSALLHPLFIIRSAGGLFCLLNTAG